MEKSASVKNIGKALTLFQTKMEKVPKDSTNPFYKNKYASLSTILESIQLPLAESGLSFSQLPDGNCLTTILIHNESGEYLQSCYDIHPAKTDPQGIGSAITYARRYALSAILGINVDDDDDGNQGSTPKQDAHTPGRIDPNPATKTSYPEDTRPWLSEKQFDSAIERINNGEVDLYAKLDKEYRMKKAYREALLGCLNLENALQNGGK